MKKLSDEELQDILLKATKLARDTAKATHSPLVYMVDEDIISEYPDGRKFKIVRDDHGNRKEIEYSG